MNLYDYITSIQYMENAYEDWSDYRKSLTDLILATASDCKSLAILGAGRCCDYDLARLAKHFPEIALYDINASAMEEAIAHYSADDKHLSDVVSIHACSFTGHKEDDLRTLTEEFTAITRRYNDCPHDHLDEEIYNALTTYYQMDRSVKNEPIHQTYDYVVVSGVHSQLNNTPAMLVEIVANLLSDQLGSVQKARFLQSWQEFIASHTKGFSLSLNEIAKSTATQKLLLGYEADNLLNPGPIDGAHQGIIDCMTQYKDAQAYQLLWPFSENSNKLYKMLFFEINL